MKFFLSLSLALFLFASSASAQGFGFIQAGSKDPINIEADQGIEWRRNESVYIARGNAIAQSGRMSVKADELRGYYRGQDKKPQAANGKDVSLFPQGSLELYRLEAKGNVTITSDGQTAEADDAFYDLDQGVFVMQGQKLQLKSEDTIVTAAQSIEYWQSKQMAVAHGNAFVQQGDNRLIADTLTARFAPNRDGKLELSTIEAVGNIKIEAKAALAQADKGVYDLVSGLATLAGNVKLTQGSNQLNGAYAEINTKTGISRIVASTDGDSTKRVRGLIVPDRAKNIKPKQDS